MEQLHLIGLDFGSTTSSAIVASAPVMRNCTTGRMELAQPSALYRSELVFTPFCADRIDEQALGEHLDRWIGQSGVDPRSLASGGVIITGLAAQRANVPAIQALVQQRVSEALFATADDPCLESWLAFMGSCYELSRTNEDYFLNLDIGGGTTNLALGKRGAVLRTGCLFAGARHFQFAAGTYRITALSSYAIRLLNDLKIAKSIGESLASDELGQILDFYATLIESAVAGDRSRLDREPFRYHEQVPFVPLSTATSSPVITFSGGVGELVYNQIRGRPLPPTTAFGDLGIDLAVRLILSPVLSQHLRTHVPLNLGHATVYGLSLHSTEVSGTTLYLPDPSILPLRDLPIVATLAMQAPPDEVRCAIDLASRSARGCGIEIVSHPGRAEANEDLAAVKQLGRCLATAIHDSRFPPDRPLVLFVSHNVGKTIGCYASDWGRLPVKLIVVDELVCRNARFASLGRLRNNIVPVSFYGICSGDLP